MNGFFVEAGALDGETMSNTLTLEVQNKWEGLLIEADPISFETMTTKHRKAWLAHACLSPHSFPQKVHRILIGQNSFYNLGFSKS